MSESKRMHLREASRLFGRARWTALALMVGTALPFTSGCSDWSGGWRDHKKVQVQFYAPPGASVSIRKWMKTPTEEVGQYDGHRLEHTPEDFAVFNLGSDKTYEFKYSSATGFPGVSIYGELDVRKVESPEAAKFVGHSFVPISLPSEYYNGTEADYHPVSGPSGVGLSQVELEHLRQGDLIRKVYFIADLQQAWETVRMIEDHIERLRSAETVLNTELELVDARFEAYRQDALYADPTEDTLAANRDESGRSATFIALEATRQRLENKRYMIREQVDDLLNEKRIRTRLLDSMKIVNRRGTLVLATPENQWEFHDAADQVGRARVYPGFAVGPNGDYMTGPIEIPALGEVLLVMRVGGRHMHWGEPPADSVAMNNE
ncbi:MAG: hypothetical protein H6817_04385 [Phycisphaerales bacterium]|nr:hypothetical protein [Phycisphaerales bacterium]